MLVLITKQQPNNTQKHKITDRMTMKLTPEEMPHSLHSSGLDTCTASAGIKGSIYSVLDACVPGDGHMQHSSPGTQASNRSFS